MEEQNKQAASPLRLLVLAPISMRTETHSVSSEPTDLAKPLANVSPFPTFLKFLTGFAPPPEIESFSGYTSHSPLSLTTRYYASNVSLWCDELPTLEPTRDDGTERTAQPTLSEWRDQMLSDEAREVREVIGGLILLLSINPSTVSSDTQRTTYLNACLSYLKGVNALRERIEDETGRDIAAIAALQLTTSVSEGPVDAATTTLIEMYEDQALSEHGIMGWDFVVSKSDNATTPVIGTQPTTEDSDTQRNKFGEKLGKARMMEVLEGVDWPLSLDDSKDEQDLDLLASEEDFFDESLFDKDILGKNHPGFKPNISVTGPHQPVRHSDPVTQQSQEFQQEMMGLRFALEKREQCGTDDNSEDEIDISQSQDTHADNDVKVDQLADMMGRVVAIKEAAAEMSTAERQKFAKREIAKIMREMG